MREYWVGLSVSDTYEWRPLTAAKRPTLTQNTFNASLYSSRFATVSKFSVESDCNEERRVGHNRTGEKRKEQDIVTGLEMIKQLTWSPTLQDLSKCWLAYLHEKLSRLLFIALQFEFQLQLQLQVRLWSCEKLSIHDWTPLSNFHWVLYEISSKFASIEVRRKEFYEQYWSDRSAPQPMIEHSVSFHC